MFINNFRWINLELAARPVTKNVLTSVFSSLCVTTNNTAAVHTCNCILVHFIIKLINSLKRLNDLCFVLYQSIKRNVFYLFDLCDKRKLFSNSSYLTKNKHVFSFTFPHVSFYTRQDCCLGRERTFSFFHKISKRFFFHCSTSTLSRERYTNRCVSASHYTVKCKTFNLFFNTFWRPYVHLLNARETVSSLRQRLPTR